MPFAIPAEPDSPWREFLQELDRLLPEAVELHCVGGFVATLLHHRRATNDLDYVEVIPRGSEQRLEQVAGRDSALAARYRVHLQRVTVANLPASYDERLTELFPGRFRHLKLLALEAHDLALSKLARNHPVDRDDVELLARLVPLDPNVLKTRYQQELRPYLIGGVEKHDQTLELWLEAYFPPRA